MLRQIYLVLFTEVFSSFSILWFHNRKHPGQCANTEVDEAKYQKQLAKSYIARLIWMRRSILKREFLVCDQVEEARNEKSHTRYRDSSDKINND